MPSVPREKYPEMNWRAADKVAAWKVFRRQMEVIFVADQIPEERQWVLILVAGGDEAYNCWDTLEDTVQDRKKVEQVWKAFEKSFEQSTSFWHFRDRYLADFRQDESETMADLDLCIKQTVRGCQWQKESEEARMIDLLYHATIYYEIRKFVQESDPNALTYEMVIEKAKAHERNVLEYKDHQASHGGANSAPSYNNPLLSAHALSKRRPSGRGNNGQHCGKCGKSHERGNYPAYGKTCNRCQGINHFKAVCRSKVAAKTGQSPHRSKKSQPPRRGSTGSYNGQGKGGGNRQHQKKKTPKKPPKQNAYAVTMKNSVPSEVTTTSGGKREKQGNVSSKMVLSGPEEEGTYNRFSCFAVHSKMSQSTNAKSKPTEGLYTDTDPDNRSEIITDMTIRMPGKAGTMMMEVKVDPGAQPSCIPLHKFKTLFPHLCRDGLPKEGLLDNTHNEFQSYNGGDMTCYGHLLIDVKDKVTKKYHPIRFYVMNTDVPRILISHAASYWLGLVRVLCDNKAPKIKRQEASIDKKSDFQAKSGHFRTSTSNSASSSQKKQTTPKTVTSGASNIPSPRYYRPSNDTKTFQINNKGHLQCQQDPKLIHQPNDKGKLPGSREAPIYHEPGTVSCKTVEDLKKLYPNSFDRLGSLKGAYNIRIDPSVKPATHARRKVPIESKEAIDRELDYLIEEEIITEQVEPTPWVSSDIPEEAKRGRKGMSGSKQLEQGHHQRAPQADDGGRDSPRTGWSNSVHKGRCFEGISSDTSYARSLSLDNVQLTSGTASILTDAFWSQNEPRRVSATDGCHSRAVSRSHRNSR